MTPRVIAALLVVAATLAAGCGPHTDGGAGDALRKTADGVGRIHSGNMTMSFTLTPRARPRDGRVGVELKGPFSLRSSGPLPLLDVSYRRIAGGTTTGARLVSTGQSAFVVAGGQIVRLTPAQAAPLRLGRGQRTLGDMGLDATRWVSDARLQPGPRIGGVPTDLVTGHLDAPAAARDFVRAARRSGADLSSSDRKRIEDAVSSSTVRVLTGHRDRLLRAVSVRLVLDLPPRLRAATGGRRQVEARFEMAIGRPNARVTISPPE